MLAMTFAKSSWDGLTTANIPQLSMHTQTTAGSNKSVTTQKEEAQTQNNQGYLNGVQMEISTIPTPVRLPSAAAHKNTITVSISKFHRFSGRTILTSSSDAKWFEKIIMVEIAVLKFM